MKYRYKCGCVTAKWKPDPRRSRSLYKTCPVHGAQLIGKRRTCPRCYREFDVPTHSNARNWCCPECRPARDLELAAKHRAKLREIGKKQVKTDRKPRRPPADPVDGLFAGRRASMPEMSPDLRGVLERAGVM